MKKTVLFLLALLPLMFGCSEESETLSVESEGEYITANISLGGEILSVYQEPMTKDLDDNDLTGIQIYTVSGDVEETPYAWGLFDDVSNISVKLKKGQEYVFEATSIIDCKDRIGFMEVDEGMWYGHPFSKIMTNKIDISSTEHLSSLYSSEVSLIEGTFIYSNVDKFYCRENLSFNGDKNIELYMNRMSFGIKVVLNNLGSGKLIIESEDMRKITINKGEDFDSIFTMPLDYNSGWDEENWKKDDYSIEKTLAFIYQNENGEKEQIASQKIKFTRNKKTVIEVNMPSEENPDNTSSALKISIEDGEMEETDKVTIN